jgi:hypothetical protein
MARKMAKQTLYILDQLANSYRIRVVDGGGAWLCRWNEATQEQSYYGANTYVWQPVFNGLIRRGWINEVHRTPGDWVYYGITDQGRDALASFKRQWVEPDTVVTPGGIEWVPTD